MRTLLTLTTCAVLAVFGGIHRTSAEDGSATEAQPAALLQGEAMTLPRDYVAELDGDIFRLQLENMGDGGVANQMVSLFDSRGGTQTARSNQTGVVEFDGVEPGVKGVAVTGTGVHAASAVYVAPEGDGNGRGNFRLPVVSIAGDQVLRNVRSYLPRHEHSAAHSTEFAPLSDYQVTGATNYQVTLGPEGTLNGTVGVPGAGMGSLGDVNVLLYRDGHSIDRTFTRPDGTFSFTGVSPGVHGIIAVGRSGYGAVAFEAVGAEQIPAVRAASFNANNQSPVLVVSMLPPSMFGQLLQTVDAAYGSGGLAGPTGTGPFGGAPFGPPPFGGAGGGFGPGGGGLGGGLGGGGAGGGGLGGLGALAALGAVGAAIAASEDDERPQAASPRNPPFGLPPGPPTGRPGRP